MRRILFPLLSAFLSFPLAAEEPPGVVVEEVTPNFAAARAGLEPGDVLLRWQRAANPPANPEPASGEITHPFDLWVVETEQAPRGLVTLLGERRGQTVTAVLPPGEWRLTTRPWLSRDELAAYSEWRMLAASEDSAGQERLVKLWEALDASCEADRPALRSWICYRVATIECQHVSGTGEAYFERSLVGIQVDHPAWAAELYRRRGAALNPAHHWHRIEELYGMALRIRGQGSLALAAGLSSLGQMAMFRFDLRAAEGYFQRALSIRESRAPGSWIVATSLSNLGLVARKRADFMSSAEYYERSLAILDRFFPPISMEIARNLDDLAFAASRSGRLNDAELYLQRSLEIKSDIMGVSLEVADTLDDLASIVGRRQDLMSAAAYYRRSLAIREKLAPEARETGASSSALGTLERLRGDLLSAQVYYHRALSTHGDVDGEGFGLLMDVINMGELAALRGDLEAAEDYYERSLRVGRAVSDDYAVSMSLGGLAGLARRRGDISNAERYYQYAMEVLEGMIDRGQLASGLDVARVLDSLGDIAVRRGDWSSAQHYYGKSLAIQEELAPESLGVARSLAEVGRAAWQLGDVSSAGECYERSLEIIEARHVDSLELGITVGRIGALAEVRGDFQDAVHLLGRSLLVVASVVPGSYWEAAALHEQAKLYRLLHRPVEALGLFRRTLTALESQANRLGGSGETRSNFLSQYSAYYRDTIDLLLEQNESTEAFHVLERSRARGLLALLAERDLLFTADLPDDLRRERQEANTENDRILAQLGDWTSLQENADAAKKELLEKLAAVRQHQAEIEAKVRATAPRLAALQYPEPLTLSEVQAMLDPGSLLLAYSLGAEKSHVFVVGKSPDDFAVLPLAITLDQARERVTGLREMWKSVARRSAELRQRTSELSELLLKPAAAQIAKAERLVILPDGPLHYLPFAALQNPTSTGGFRYLIEAKPVSVVGSATLLAELKKDRKAPLGEGQVVAFADPLYVQGKSEEVVEEPVLRSIERQGFSLPPLPATRAEAAALGRLYPESSTLYLGADAKEETAKAAGKSATILHFACHGLVDDRQPLSSALALSIPTPWHEGEDNGLLQAWEIFEQVRLDADLVTLSACDTALGKESAGEGLLGLTRAFQYAGARTVLASLWAVADESTAALMERFYRHLRAGMSKDEALRQAQLELLTGPIEVTVDGNPVRADYSQPFFWAPFEVIGDWR